MIDAFFLKSADNGRNMWNGITIDWNSIFINGVNVF